MCLGLPSFAVVMLTLFSDTSPGEDWPMATEGWQTHWHKHPGVRSGDQLTRGERAADRMRNPMGSWPFVFGFFTVMILWAVANSVFYVGGPHGKHGFDPFPHILLNHSVQSSDS